VTKVISYRLSVISDYTKWQYPAIHEASSHAITSPPWTPLTRIHLPSSHCLLITDY